MVQDGDIRVIFVNIHGIPSLADHPKNTMIREAINKTGASIIGLAETNLDWNRLNGKNKWEDRSFGWWEDMTSTHCNNILEQPKHHYQPGGNLQITRGKCRYRIIGSGRDKSNMGRWTWQRISGKTGISTRIITAYRPCKSKGLTTTYMQQRRILDVRKIRNCPRMQMIDDLTEEIKEWLDNGEQIILMIDLNDDVTRGLAHDKLKAIGLQESITTRHGNSQPSTCNRGNKAIDGMYVSSTIMIQKGGYCPFNTFPSDHRALWIDVTINNICGNNMAPVLHPQARRLKCNDPKIQKKWTTLYLKALAEQNAIQRVYKLQTQLVQPLTEPMIQEYEKLRRIRTNARRHADNKCRKLRMGGVPYSVELSTARKKIELWQAILSWKLGRKVNSKYIKRLERRVQETGCRGKTLEEIKTAVATSFTVYWDLKSKASDLRTTFLQKKANELAKAKKTDQTNVYSQLIAVELQRKSARKIKYVLNKVLGGGVTKISLRNQQGEWEETTNKIQIELGCAKENESKYRQTENTPCMTGQLVQDIGYLGNTGAAQQILDGTYATPPGTNRYTEEYIQQLRYDPRAHNDPPIATLPTSEYVQGWKKKKEFTSAGKSGWTFSHSKTCALHKESADFEAAMAHIPYITGYTPKEWQVGVDIMIYKKINLDRVDKLRTIVLKEADANFNDGRMGKEMMQHAERNNMIAREQYGSRKGHSSIDHAVNKRLSYDLMRLYRKPGALCSNDAKSCYDRILHSIVALSMKRLGIPAPPIECMLRCIQTMDHHIRTTHGDSNITYSSKDTPIPFQGVLQGNGASPSIWVAVSTPLLNMMRQANHGMHIQSAITQQQSNIVAFAFVDDTDLVQGQMGGVNITTEEVMQEMQEAILRWEGGLKATGGAIVPEKSFVYPIDFKFTPAGKVKYKTVQEINARFEVPNAQDQIIALKQLEANEASETLGVFLAPDGNNDAAKEALLAKANLWSELVHKGHLNAEDVMRAMDSTITQTLNYSLPALTLSEKECTRIMAPILNVALPQSKVCRTFPRKVVYGPKSMMGLGKNDLYLKQGALQIGLFQQYIHTDTITGELLRANAEIIKIHLGIGQNFFHLDYNILHRITPPSLLKHVWGFTHQNNITIQEEATSNLILRRVNDKFLMEEIALNNRVFTGTELAHINRCRLYLQVTSLADITTGNGLCIRKGVMSGTMETLNEPYYQWPKQIRPGVTSWRLWRKAIKSCFLRGVGLYIKAGMQLGRWNDGAQDQWKWFYSRHNQHVYQRQGNRWKVYRRQGRGPIGMQPHYTYISDAMDKPAQVVRCTVFQDNNGRYRLSGSDRDIPRPLQPNHPQTTIISNNTVHGNLRDIISSIQNGTAKLVSDGSYLAKEGIGTAGWVIEGSQIGNQIRGRHETPGSALSQCSHRSEMWGMLGLIMTINDLCQTHHILHGTVTAKCDGEGTINILSWMHAITKNSRKHFDIIQALQAAISASPIEWKFCHLKGHQDKYISYSQLDRWAQLNVLVDTIAKQELTRIIASGGRQGSTMIMPHNKCTIYWTNRDNIKEAISSHLSDTIIDMISTERIKGYWEEKRHIGPAVSQTVDWDILQRSAKHYTKGKWLAKQVTGICGVGKMLKLWKHQNHNTCPRCGRDNENTEHVILCKAPSAISTWEQAINNLERWMKDNDAEPHMLEIICNSLRAWKSMEPLPAPTNEIPHIVMEAMIEQDSIGWYNLINGFISKKWAKIQQAHFQDIGNMKSPILWISRFQKRIWEIPWTMWQHRNEFLHNDGRTVHFQETAAINQAIRDEYDLAQHGLPDNYQHLFQEELEDIINQDIYARQAWLTSVWVARDCYTPTYLRQGRNKTAEAFYLRWKKKLR
jgi:hypothetical protein